MPLLVLADFQADNGWNQRNWILTAQQQHTEVCKRPGVLDRLAEAWAWLNSRAFVAWRPDQDTPDSRRVTTEGQRALDIGIAERLDGELLPILAKARRQVLQRDYEEAVFAAFRTVEETVRERTGMTAGGPGVKLLRQAFKPDEGPPADMVAEAGEQETQSTLFAGAIGAS